MKTRVTVTFDVSEDEYNVYEDELDNFLNSFNAENVNTLETQYDENANCKYYTVKYETDVCEGYENVPSIDEYTLDLNSGELLNADDEPVNYVDDNFEELIKLETDNDVAEFLVNKYDTFVQKITVASNVVGDNEETIYDN